jgi:hypothetical protein
MRTSAFAVVTVAAVTALAFAAPVPQPNAREAAQLVEKLGATEFAEREAASKRLEELGVLALDDLRAACKSDNPEIADRAKDLVRKIERRVSSERILAPTLVELDAKDAPLDDVLAALSKQAGYEVVLGGLKAEEAAGKKITVATGKVPFWSAVLKVCDVAELQVAGSGGFIVPGAMPYRPRANQIRGALEGTSARVAADINTAVILEARNDTKKRPASVQGAVLVEAFEMPRGAFTPNGTAATLHFLPEPKVAWQMVANLKITKALDTDGRKLTHDLTPPPRTLDRLGRPTSVPLESGGNTRQAVAKFKTTDGPVTRARELAGSAYGLVRAAAEPLATVALDPDKAVTVRGPVGGVEVTASERTEKDKRFVYIKLSYNSIEVVPARNGDLEVVRKGADANVKLVGEDKLTHGLRITDADGKPFETSLASTLADFDRLNPRRFVIQLKLELVPAKDGPMVPAKVVFWGATTKPVEVPFVLKDVPLK